MKKKYPFKWLRREVANLGPHVALVRSEEDYYKVLKYCGIKDSGPWMSPLPAEASCHYLDHAASGELCCIVALHVKPGGSKLEVFGLLVHEAVHIVDAYFSKMGETCPASEQRAYAVQMVSQELIWEYKRQTKKPSKGK